MISLAERLPSTLVRNSFSIVSAVSSARTGVISAAAGTAAGVAWILLTFARLGLPDPGSAVIGTLIVTPSRRLLLLPDAGIHAVRKTRAEPLVNKN
jgi:hypothetical protein